MAGGRDTSGKEPFNRAFWNSTFCDKGNGEHRGTLYNHAHVHLDIDAVFPPGRAPAGSEARHRQQSRERT